MVVVDSFVLMIAAGAQVWLNGNPVYLYNWYIPVIFESELWN